MTHPFSKFGSHEKTRSSWPGVRVGANCPGISWISQLLSNQRAQSGHRSPPKDIRRGIFSKDLPSKSREDSEG